MIAAGLCLALLSAAASTPSGEDVYLRHCQACHLPGGQGIPGVFPPLAGSDFLRDTNRVIRVVCEGLNGPITVNGTRYNGVMPMLPLSDEEVAAVLSYVYRSWGNAGGTVQSAQVARVRATLRIPTLEAALAAAEYPPLPAAPAGTRLREVVRLPEFCSRLHPEPGGSRLLALGQGGNLWRVNVAEGSVTPLLAAADYLSAYLPEVLATGLALDGQRRLYIAANQKDKSGATVTNRVCIYRADPRPQGDWSTPRPWMQVAYPFGVGPFNHGVGHLAFGPDGFLYAGSGSRTDGNEPGKGGAYFTGGETPLTAGLWRIDPSAPTPQPEMFARGLRNPYGFCWDGENRLVLTDNGPDAHLPEELNVIEPGGHYGFPFRFGASLEKPYPHTPDLPAGLQPALPVRNDGPDGGAGQSTFDPHSCPGGLLWLGPEFPARWAGGFLVPRFGNLLRVDPEAGYDLLHLRLSRDGDRWVARTTRMLAPLGRPLDVVALPGGRVYLLEYSRHTTLTSGTPQMPGRILELVFKE